MPQLDPTWFLTQVVWLTITFVVLYVVLVRGALPRLAETIQERQERINDDLHRAEALKKEAEGVLAAYDKLMAETRGKAEAKIREAAEKAAKDAEAQNAALQAKLAAERRNWRQTLGELDARLADLERRLEVVVRGESEPPAAVPSASAAPGVNERLSALGARLAKTERSRIAAEDRCREALAQLGLEREGRAADQTEIATLRAEVVGLQQQLDGLLTDGAGPDASSPPQLRGTRVLVVGARPAQITHWRTLVERKGGELLHHDGGIDDWRRCRQPGH